jgi:hypothetical protein
MGLTNYFDQAAIIGHFHRLVNDVEDEQLSRAYTKEEI